jgi:diaminopimelate epimerase
MKKDYKPTMKNSFVKMQGLGNDFAIFDGRTSRLEIPAEKIRALGDRRLGIGFDQMVIIDPAKSAESDAFLRIYNADGSEVGACGNATRCIVALLARELGRPAVTIETKAARIEGLVREDRVVVDMGKVHLEWKDIPLSREEDTLSLSIEKGVLRHPVAVNVGNPHAVFFLQNNDLDRVPLDKLGPEVENHPLFPEKVNVEVAHVLDATRIRMRVWERGAGLTRACGTGACAVAVAGVRRGLSQRRVTVMQEGGDLDIEWRESDSHILMTGAVAEVYRGEIEL